MDFSPFSSSILRTHHALYTHKPQSLVDASRESARAGGREGEKEWGDEMSGREGGGECGERKVFG